MLSSRRVSNVSRVTFDPLREALRTLGIDRLALGVHESAFPAGDLDCGHGSAHAAGDSMLSFVRALGFDVLQLGPGGQVSDGIASPYDCTAFARNLLRLDAVALTADEDRLLSRDEVVAANASASASVRAERAEPARARIVLRRLVELAYSRFRRLRDERPEHPAAQGLARFRAEAHEWIERDALYEVLVARSGGEDADRLDPAMQSLFAADADAVARRRQIAHDAAESIERVVFAQWLLDRQALALLARARAHGLALFGDLQIGWSPRDRLLHREAFASGWLLGAPPSRTNRSGQAWGYPVLDPDQLDDVGSPARRTFARQLHWLLRCHDGLRIDHPHGLVCPWIYREHAADPIAAVQQGTRAFASPDREDPDLRRWAIAGVDDLDRTLPRYADGWVRRLEPAQVGRYSRLFDAVLHAAAARGLGTRDLAVEVLSTCPTPLREVLRRHGLGRFVVTQKADPERSDDVYRTDRAGPQDWVMLGNHDTTPIYAVAARWLADGSATARATYLAGRLEPDPAERAATARRFCASAGALVQAHLADLFLGPARNVFVYFTDLFGELEPFNRAGIVHEDNWRRRLPPDYRAEYRRRRLAGRALDLRQAVVLALRARGAAPQLIAALPPPPDA